MLTMKTPESLSFGCFERQLALTTAAFSRLPIDSRLTEARISLHDLGKVTTDVYRQGDVAINTLEDLHRTLIDDILTPVCDLPNASSFKTFSVLQGSLQATRTLQQIVPDINLAHIGMEEGVNAVFMGKGTLNFSRMLILLDLFTTGQTYGAELHRSLQKKLNSSLASNTLTGALQGIGDDLCVRENGTVQKEGGRPSINLSLTPYGKEVVKRAYLAFYQLMGLADANHRFADPIMAAGCFGGAQRENYHFFNVPFVKLTHFSAMMIFLSQEGQGFGSDMMETVAQQLFYELRPVTFYTALNDLEKFQWVTSPHATGAAKRQNKHALTESGLRAAIEARHTWLSFLGFPIDATFPHYEVMMGRL